ncbi:hypothetical protein JFV30_17540 [Pseudomonas sp. TH32]|uniref:hypothetical protein n=1 Tax=unclassified Pseudomonas TaxID=196821 RepID=UPI0019146B4F|nr:MULTISPECIES: hypothetical protein [unclassified Pseudomonas]MBK5438546.1 hypothetical protein [Pseudomonas sp. TH32]MDF3198904.1 hypothetical protein [Pseudomonas sp. 1912-s]
MSTVGQTYQTFAPPPPPQATPAPMRSTAYDTTTVDDIADAFVKNSSQFVDKKTGKVSLEKLMQVGDRKNTGNAASDNITALALAVLQRNLFDGDLIDRSEEFLRTGGRSEKPKEPDPKKNLPVAGKGDGLQRQRVENSGKGTEQANPYAGKSNAQLADSALARFSSLADADGALTDKSLASVASGTRSDGTPASTAEINLANALLDQPGLFSGLDGDKSGKFDGKISRDDLGAFKYKSMKPDELLNGIKDHFGDILGEGGDPNYLNVGELEQAAGIKESPKTYTSEVTALARELLARTQLLRELDIGINGSGTGPGYQDNRFDMDNINHLLKKYSPEQKTA